MARGFGFSLLPGVLCLSALSAGCDGPVQPSPPGSLSFTTISPTSGSRLGSTPVTISGAGFKAGATVQFGGVAAAAASVTSPSTINVTAPAHAEGAVTVVVTNPDGKSASLDSAFTYEVDPPFAISGVVTEMTEEGEVAVEGVRVFESGTFTGVFTDSQGAYRLGGLRRSTFHVSTSAPGYVATTTPVTASSDLQLDLRVVRIASFVLSGIVYESTPTGRVPLEGVVLYCDACGSPVGHTFVTTDANGFYRFEWAFNGTTYIQFISKDGYRYAGPSELLGIPVNVNGNTKFDIELVKR